MRIWVEIVGGNGEWLERSGSAKRLPGMGTRLFVDRTEKPMPTVGAGSRAEVVIERDDVNSRPVNVIVEKTSEPAKSADEKPPYAVPSMEAIRKIKPNGLKAISTFSGCGGSSLGYRMAGFRILWVNEFVKAARESYAANAAPRTIIDDRDIRDVDPLEVLKTVGLEPGELDLLDGSPPCASFSTAGKRQKGWGKSKKYSDRTQRSDDLFFEYVRFLDAMRPKVFVAENVSGLVKGVAKGYFKKILAAMKEAGGGYEVEAKLLDAQWLGVPQQRQRIIFIGVRKDLGLKPAHPKPLPYRYSIRDALPWLGAVAQGTEEDAKVVYRGQKGGARFGKRERSLDGPSASVSAEGYGAAARHQAEVVIRPGLKAGQRRRGNRKPYSQDDPAPTIKADSGVSETQFLVERHVEPESDISRYAIGREWDKLKIGEQTYYGGNLSRPDPEKPSLTVTATGGTLSASSVTHPYERRKFSIAELKRLCAFPDDVILIGSYGQQWERLGRAVPPVMMSHVARVIRDEILLKLKKKCR